MKMAAFEHHRPDTIDEAIALLAQHGSEAKVVAGGQSLVPLLAMRLAKPAHLVDVTAVRELDVIGASNGGAVEIGASVRQSAAERSAVVAERVPLLAAALPWIGHRPIRNRGTVCGSLAHADPAAELPAVALALDAQLVVQSAGGARTVRAADFFTGYLSTVLADDEIVIGAQFTTCTARHRAAVTEVSRRRGDFALAGVACALDFGDDGRIASAALALFGVADTPVRARDAEALLAGNRVSPELVADAAAVAAGALRPPGDVHASAAYRRHVAGVLVRRALAQTTRDATSKEAAA